MGTESFLGIKWPWHGFDHQPSSSADIKGRVQLYLYSGLCLHGPF